MDPMTLGEPFELHAGKWLLVTEKITPPVKLQYRPAPSVSWVNVFSITTRGVQDLAAPVFGQYRLNAADGRSARVYLVPQEHGLGGPYRSVASDREPNVGGGAGRVPQQS